MGLLYSWDTWAQGGDFFYSVAQTLGTWASVFAAVGSEVGAHRLSCSSAWAILPDQDWAYVSGIVRTSVTTGPPVSPLTCVFCFLRFICFWLCWVFVAVRGLSLVAASRDHALVAAYKLLIAVSSLVVEQGLCSSRASAFVAPELKSAGSVVEARGLSCSAACGIFLDKGLNLCTLHWRADSLLLSHQGSPCLFFNSSIFFLNFGCAGSLVWHLAFLQLCHAGGFSCCWAWAPKCVQAQQLQCTSLVIPRHVAS